MSRETASEKTHRLLCPAACLRQKWPRPTSRLRIMRLRMSSLRGSRVQPLAPHKVLENAVEVLEEFGHAEAALGGTVALA